jgi:hypothetical protein
VQLDTGVAEQPRLDLLVLVGGVVVANDMQPAARVGLSDLLEEGQDLSMAGPANRLGAARVGPIGRPGQASRVER